MVGLVGQAISSISTLRPVAVSCVRAGSASRKARVTMPVPEAVSNALDGAWEAIRYAISAA